MTRYIFFLLLIFPLLTSCAPKVKMTASQFQPPAAVKRIEAARKALRSKHSSRQEIPSVLGGIVQSDNWTVYRDKQQEEFSGHVFYDNGTYTFKSDYALSERAYNRLTAKGNVYLRQKENAATYEAYAHTARYNYKTQQGTLQARNAATPVKLIYTPANEPPVTATAQKVTIDLDKQIFTLEGNVHVERNTPQGLQTLSAKKALIKQLQDYVKLEGNAVLSDGLRSLEADTIIYDGANNQSYAYGARPLLHGSTQQGTFAIIADKASSDAEGNQIILDGKVQGWFVSPQINQIDFSKFNQGFNYGTAQ